MKQRLDVLLCEKSLAPTRARAKALIMEGVVRVNGRREDKAGATFDQDDIIELVTNPIPFVSRGGLKIQKALDTFEIDINNKVVMDVGASTGGFTDCMLQRGASHVYSIDVGYGQLDYKLRMDDRVTVMERTNIRNIEPESLNPKPVFSTADVSFISLKKVVPAMESVMEADPAMVTLIKPQFEAGKENVGKGGVVRNKNVHESVITDIANYFLEREYGVLGLTYSPIKGPKGNIEYLIYIQKHQDSQYDNLSEYIGDLVNVSHEELDSL